MIEFDDVEAAAARLAGHVQDTPCLLSQTLSEITGATVFLKFENLQFTASFKERGALNRLSQLDAAQHDGRPEGARALDLHRRREARHDDRRRNAEPLRVPGHALRVVAGRDGDHAAGTLRGVELREPVQCAALLERGRELKVLELQEHRRAGDPGQGTVGLEMLRAHPDLEDLVVPIGGGGLIAGVATVARRLQPAIRVTGVQVERFALVHDAIEGGRHPLGAASIAEGIAVDRLGERTMPIIRRRVDRIVLVDEGDVEHAVLMLLEIEKTVVEGAGAAGLAALLRHPERFRGRRIGLVLSGGNIDPLLLASIIERGMVRSGRLARLFVDVRDVPGALAQVTALLAEEQANIEEIRHERAFGAIGAQRVEVEIVVQTRGPGQVGTLLARLRDAGFAARTG